MGTRVIRIANPRELSGLVASRAVPCLAGVVPCALAPTPLDALLAALLATVASSWLHEAGHVLAYWRVRGGSETVALRHVGVLATSVVVARPDEGTRWVALAGPAPVASLGVAAAAAAWLLGFPVLWGVAFAFLIHATGLVPGSSDGNRVWGLAPGSRARLSARP